MKYINVENIEEATHWIPANEENFVLYDDVTVGTPYKLNWDSEDEEFYIYDNHNINSTIYLWHNGNFVKEVAN